MRECHGDTNLYDFVKIYFLNAILLLLKSQSSAMGGFQRAGTGKNKKL